ncbi:hypothetical protein [Symmachiella dynata]|uniref:hypothetical protein n=1 Tax=Symmachiella dynata TaxID=2527995 RepID=UPI0011A4A27E|nr:hypothetical protein [Symmachiella dynata]
MPACALSRWAPQIEELEDLGFSLCGYIKSDTIGQKCEAYSYWIDPHGVVVSQLCWQMHSSIEQTRRSMISYFPQGREMITASLSPDESLLSTVLSPDYITCHCEPETTSIKQLYGIHNNHPEIAEAACLTKDAFLATYREHRIKFMNDVIENGFIRQLTQREVNQLAAVDQGL